ncbi:ATP-dependent RNA helicase DHX36, partial [Asbolus verrucosus]
LGSIQLSNTKKCEIQAVLNSTVSSNLFVCDSNRYEHVEDSSFKRDFLRVINESIDEKLIRMTSNIVRNPKLDEVLYEQFKLKQNNPHYIYMLNKRKRLPSYTMRDQIIKMISDNQVVVISGETGCGKTTQVAQFILDDFIEKRKGSECRIICTQPRRISAISVAERVAEERAENLGSSVGYHIRLEKCLPLDRGSICFCTTGVVLKLMENDASLSWLRNPNSEQTDLYLVLALLINICERERDQGAILVFLTGFKEISALNRLMFDSGKFPPYKYLIYPLHSLMPTIDQRQIFETPPGGTRKIIIATNIAETSITIDDVVFVIDCGKIKVSGFDAATNTETLAPQWVSLANASQRSGRAGRVKPGACFHLFSRARKMVLEQFQTPEILRKRLEDVILTAKVLQLGKIEPFFRELMDSPSPEAVSLALDLLKRLNALTDEEQLTPLGYHLAKLPMAPQIGKMILFGAIFNCLDPILSIAASLDFKDPFQLPVGLEKEVIQRKLQLADGIRSDHLLFHKALRIFEECGSDHRQFCWQYFLNSQILGSLQGIKKHFAEYLYEMNFVPNPDPNSLECNRNSHNLSLIKAIICAGLYPNVAVARKPGKAPLWTPQLIKFDIHPKSVLFGSQHFDTNILVYYRKVYSSNDYIHDATLVRSLPVIFFGDKYNQICENGQNMIAINNNLKFECTVSTALIIKELRDRFNWFLEHKISHPEPVIWERDDETKILDIIIELISCEDLTVGTFMSYKRDRMGNKKPQRDKMRPPPHLKGKEIGLFYAKRNRERREQGNKKPLGTILLSASKKNQIQRILNSTSFRSLFACHNSNEYEHVEDSLFKRDFLRVLNESIDEKLMKMASNIVQDSRLDEILYEQFKSKQENPKYVHMLDKRKKLPSFTMKDEILQLINENQIAVISGETGCGKTTQVAQFILDDYIENRKGSICRIICTQPRRISAISVAERVAEERAETLGDSVGYHIRLEKRFPRERGSICYCTTGVVLKMMESDASLSWVSHLILDEIHERDVMSDFILALIKKVIAKRKDLKIILMSATLNSEKFSKYYNNSPHLNIPGFTYPVREYYLEDVLARTNFTFDYDRSSSQSQKEFSQFIEPHVRLLEAEKKYSRHVCIQLRNPKSEQINLDLILALLIDICEKEKDEGAILVFLTGFQEISTLCQKINECGSFPRHKYLVFPLHSLMPSVEQKQIFEAPPSGMRKIIVATNIAETSITIDDVVFVIDCGKIKMTGFNAESNTETLVPEWVSLANASQRKGRAGRVKPGVCFHLYSKGREMALQQYQTPEILRKRLEDVILVAKMLQLGKIEPFFQQLIDSPDPEAVSLSLNLLKRLNALTDDEKLTPLGYHLAKLPMAPQMGKMILFGAIFSCLDPILSIAASLAFKDAFQLPMGKEKEANHRKLELANGHKSDHLLFYEALRRYEECGSNSRNFCWRYFLSSHTLKLLVDMKKQFMQYLCEMNFVSNSDPKSVECNKNSQNLSLIKAIICAGLYPNVSISKIRGKAPVWTPEMKRLNIHPKSILSECKYFDLNMLVYYKKVYSSSDFIHDVTLIHPLPVIFFGDNYSEVCEEGHNMITINETLKFKCTESTAKIIKELRDRFNWFLEYKISHPGPIIWGKDDETKVLDVIMELITCEDMEIYDDDTFEDRD